MKHELFAYRRQKLQKKAHQINNENYIIPLWVEEISLSIRSNSILCSPYIFRQIYSLRMRSSSWQKYNIFVLLKLNGAYQRVAILICYNFKSIGFSAKWVDRLRFISHLRRLQSLQNDICFPYENSVKQFYFIFCLKYRTATPKIPHTYHLSLTHSTYIHVEFENCNRFQQKKQQSQLLYQSVRG